MIMPVIACARFQGAHFLQADLRRVGRLLYKPLRRSDSPWRLKEETLRLRAALVRHHMDLTGAAEILDTLQRPPWCLGLQAVCSHLELAQAREQSRAQLCRTCG